MCSVYENDLPYLYMSHNLETIRIPAKGHKLTQRHILDNYMLYCPYLLITLQ